MPIDEADRSKAEICGYLEKNGRTYTKQIAEGVGLSDATTSKYLQLLLSEKVVKRTIQRPYVFWEIVGRNVIDASQSRKKVD